MSQSKRAAFVEYYIQEWDGAKAARLAGYSVRSARQQAHRLLTNADIHAAINARIAELKMQSDEVLLRLADQARGSMGDFISLDERGEVSIDIRKAAEARKLHLIKKLKKTVKRGDWGSETTIEIELYDAQAAQVHLGKHHRLFAERVEFDWVKELEAAGLDPNELENGLIEEFERHLLAGADGADRERVAEGAGAGDGTADEQP